MRKPSYWDVVIFRHFVPDSAFGTYANVVRHGHFTLKQLRLSALNEMHTNSYTGSRLLSLEDLESGRRKGQIVLRFTLQNTHKKSPVVSRKFNWEQNYTYTFKVNPRPSTMSATATHNYL